MGAVERIDTGGMIVPPELRGSGLRLNRDETTGVVAIVLPPELRQNFNLVSPVSQLTVMNEMWRPALAVIHLDPNEHGYPGERTGDVALSKRGILALADGAGISVTTDRMDKAGLKAEEIGWHAFGKIMQADGRNREISDHYVLNEQYVKEEIWQKALDDEEKYAKKDNRPADRAKAEDKARQRWMKERKYLSAKAETGAILRMIRQALQLPHALSARDFAKPWITVRVAFTPDMSDPAVRSQVIDHAHGAASRLYGLPPTNYVAEYEQAPAIAEQSEVLEGEVVDAPAPPTPPAPAPAGDEDPDAAYAEYVRQQEAESAAPDDGATNSWESIAAAAGATVVNFGKHSGLSIGDIYSRDGSYLDWLCSSQYQPKNEQAERIKSHSADYLKAAIQLGLPRGTSEKAS